MRLLILLFLSTCSNLLSSQLAETHLPIIIIDTNDDPIFDEPKTPGTISIIYNGPNAINNISDPPNEYSGNCGIELRGSSSLDFEKNSYSFEMWDEDGMDMDTSFLGLKKEEDFILNGPYSDKSLMNNVLILQLARDLGQYASPTRYVELILNNEYMGLYVLMEKIKRDKNRIDIAKLTDTDISGDDLTGGYIFRIDHDKENGWESKYDKHDNNEPLYIQYVYPKANEILPEQETYIQDLITDWEDALISNSFANDQDKHYTQYIHLRSFVDNFIINEFSKNVDAYRLSSYFYKDKDSNGGRIHAGPVWDYNLSLANASYCNCSNPDGWMYYQCRGQSPFWWDRLFTSFTFTTALKCRWEELRETTLSEQNLIDMIDTNVAELGDAVDRNFERWPILGEWVWPNSDLFGTVQSHDEVVSKLKNWMLGRLAWMDENMPGTAAICDLFDDPEFEISTAVEDFEREQSILKVYPNPTQDNTTVESMIQMERLSLIDELGREVYIVNGNIGYQYKLDLSDLDMGGSYVLKVITKDGAYGKRLLLMR